MTGPASPHSAGGRLQRWVSVDPDVVRQALWVSVWGRWLIWLAGVVMLALRPDIWYPEQVGAVYLNAALAVVNAVVHYRLWADRDMTWGWMLALAAVDVALITSNVAVNIAATGNLDNIVFITYYPALAVFAVVFSSLRLVALWVTATAAVYTAVAVSTGPGLDVDAGQELVLFGRLFVMYLVAVGISLIVRYERTRTAAATARERQAHQQRVELSQQIHDTTAQTAYMIALGIEGAARLSGDTNAELTQRLEATAELARSAMWDLRRPIDLGGIVEGRSLTRVLGAHTATFSKITSVPAEMVHTGEEPPDLSEEVKSGLFCIAHNALTNAFLHACASNVEVSLDFGPDAVRLYIADDGVGLPAGYAQAGRGFPGMSADAERIGGRLTIESNPGPDPGSRAGGGGTAITCIVACEPAPAAD